jgi:hypothetical protein
MLDSIGLGKSIANLIYLVVFILIFIGTWFFVRKKNIFGVIFWISINLNALFYLYFMGNYRLYPKFFYLIVNNYWPWINIGLFILLVFNYIKNRRKK